jgi:hypothetical protein
MRLINKYKYYDRCFHLVRSFPNKIFLKFKKSKWKKIQQFFKKSRRITFLNRGIIKAPFKVWERLQLLYKESINLKTSIALSHDQAFNLKFYKKNFIKKHTVHIDILSQNFVKPFFSLMLLLYILNFTKSSYSAKQILNRGKIYVNCKKKITDTILKKGDVVFIKCLKKNIEKTNTNLTFCYSFLEIDYYTNTFTVLKNLDEFSFQDLSMLLKESIDFKKVLYYIKKN